MYTDQKVIDAISLLFLSFCANSTVGLESISLHASEQCLRLINIGMQKDGPLEAVASAKGRTVRVSIICMTPLFIAVR